MGFYSQWLFPRILDLAMKQKQIVRFRERIGETAEGSVLDLGIGSGVNWPFYGSRVRRVYGIDPSPELLKFARERARDAEAPVELVCGSGEAMPLESKSIDTVAVTFTLCSVSDPITTLAEARRVLKPAAVCSSLIASPTISCDPPASSSIPLETGYLRGPRPMVFVYSGSARPL